MKKEISPKGYRVLATIWTLAAASMAVAAVRQLPEFRASTLCLLAASIIAAACFWRACRRAEEGAAGLDPFDAPPKFSGRSVPFDDDPPSGALDLSDDPNKDSEENDNER